MWLTATTLNSEDLDPSLLENQNERATENSLSLLTREEVYEKKKKGWRKEEN